MHKNIQTLLASIHIETEYTTSITGLNDNTHTLLPGECFIAVPGFGKGVHYTDGRAYIIDAVQKGASCVLFEENNMQEAWLPKTSVPLIPVRDLRTKIGRIASAFYNNPSAELIVIGVTGTNGKSTITYGLTQVLNTCGIKAMAIGTLGYGNQPHLTPLNNTTPSALILQKLLHQARQNVQVVVMEVSSHGLDQHRVDGIDFDYAIFSNLTQDHLDYHLTMDDYKEAKLKLFAFSSLKEVILNAEQPLSEVIKARLANTVKINWYGVTIPASLHNHRKCIWADALKPVGSTLTFMLHDGPATLIRTKLLGKFNVENILAIYSAAKLVGAAPTAICAALLTMSAPLGRMERLQSGTFPQVIIDYAHTPDALEKALQAARMHAKREVWLVFGAGGDRDKEKRPLMGKIAEKFADKIVITNDNPRSESAESIIMDILGSLNSPKIKIIMDRKTAITYAIEHALADDIVLIAGKGHETTQVIGKNTEHFSDKEVVQGLLYAHQKE